MLLKPVIRRLETLYRFLDLFFIFFQNNWLTNASFIILDLLDEEFLSILQYFINVWIIFLKKWFTHYMFWISIFV